MYTLRGLLVHNDGTYDVAVDNGSGKAVYRVHIDQLSSPQSVNRAHASLGRKPGHDVYKVVRKPDSGIFKAGEYIDGIGQKERWVADFHYPMQAFHDLVPGDHVLADLGMPVGVVDISAATAARLKATYREQLYDSTAVLPEPVGKFIAAHERLPEFTERLYKAVNKAGLVRPHARELVIASVSPLIQQMMQSDSDAVLFRDIGAIDRNAGELEVRMRMRDITAAYIAELARTFMVLDLIRPDPNLARKPENNRRNHLVSLIVEYSDTQLVRAA